MTERSSEPRHCWARLAARRIAIIVAVLITDATVDAELDNQVFTSKTAHLRIVVPRGWRATDQPSYPGLLLWMMRSQPEGRIVLTSEPFTRELFCSWSERCRYLKEPLAARMACALGEKLQGEYHMHVGPPQAGPKENEEAGLPSVWIEYDDGKHFIRQAIAFDDERSAVSLVLSSPTAAARATHVRAFEQALRTLQRFAIEELADEAGSGSATESPAAPEVDLIRPCTKQ